MIEILLRMFVKDYSNTEDQRVRVAYGKFAGLVGIVCNVLLFLGKLLAGLLAGSISIMADAANNLADAASSIVSLLGFKMAEKPADPEHPYGHARYEYLSGLFISVMILFIGFELLKTGVDKILNPSDIHWSWLSIAILVASILTKLWMAVFNRTLGRRIDSSTLIAASADSRNDVISTSAVIVSMIITHFTSLNLDGYMTTAVALFILYSGVQLLRETIDPLLGRAPDPEFVEKIRDTIMSHPEVLGTHDLMVHDYGPGRQFASVHVEVAAETNVLESHDMIDNIERQFLECDGIQLIIHLDPIVTSDPSVYLIREWLSQAVTKLHPSMTIHDLRIVPGCTHTNIIFDCVVPMEYHKEPNVIRDEIRALVAQQYPDHYCVITIDRNFAILPHKSNDEGDSQ